MISLSGLDRKLISNKYLIISSIMVFIFNIVLFYKYLYWNFDDSYIVFRIVHNILNGDGWVYNVGEVYNASTSALNTIAITLLSYFINNIPVSAHVVGAVGVFLTGMMFFHISRDDLGDCLGLIGALFLMKIMAFNSTWGLETHLFIGLVFLFIFFEKRKRSAVWVTLGVITLARPDGALLITLKALWEFFPKKVIPWKGLVLVLFVVTPWVIYSVVTFEQIFPDTLSQKIWQGKSGYWGSGLIYLNGLSAKYIENAGIIEILILLAAIPGVLILVKIRSPFIYLVLLCVLQQIVYVIFNVPFYHWYHAVLDITLNLLGIYTFGYIVKKIRILEMVETKKFVKYFSFCFVFLFVVIYSYGSQSKLEVDGRDDGYTKIIKLIEPKYSGDSLGLTEVGTIGYYTDKRIVDIVGLTSKSNQFVTQDRMDVFYKNPPSLLLLHEPPWELEHSIYFDPRFKKTYSVSEKFNIPPNPMSLYSLNPGHKELNSSYRFETFSQLEKSEIRSNDFVYNSEKVTAFLGRVNGKITPLTVELNQESIHQFKGWALDKETKNVPKKVWLILKSKNQRFYIAEATRFKRPDVVKHFNFPEYLMSGFILNVNASKLPSGGYSVFIGQRLKDGKIHLHPTVARVERL